MPAPTDGRPRGDVGNHLRIGESVEVTALYPNLYFAPLASIAALPMARLVDAVLHVDRESPPAPPTGPGEDGQRAQPIAQFVVAIDPPQRFDPELSMREPLELQVWPDGSFAVEIEFVGRDVRTDPDAGAPLREVLAQWADARGWRLFRLANDRGRSLPDVWNASFARLDGGGSVADAVDFGRRAAAVAEAHIFGGESVERLLALLRSGDPDALIGTPVTSVFQPRPAPVPGDGADFKVALDVCAFANGVEGGLLVLGLEEQADWVAAVSGLPAGGGAERVEAVVRTHVFPPPEGLLVEEMEAGGGAALVAVQVPPQDRVLKPFLVHGAVIDDRLHQLGVTMVERCDTTIHVQGIAALHAQISAGRALLRRDGMGGQSG